MSIRMNKEASDALKGLLTSKGIEATDIRVFVAGFSCSGPQFNLAIDPAKEGDYSVEIDGFTLRVEQKLIDEFGGFEIIPESTLSQISNLNLLVQVVEADVTKTLF